MKDIYEENKKEQLVYMLKELVICDKKEEKEVYIVCADSKK